MDLTPDQTIFWQSGFIVINATLIYTWVVMLILVAGSWFVTRQMTTGPEVTRRQLFLETTISIIRDQIDEISEGHARSYIPFIGTLFLFISIANLLSIIPRYQPPTASLSTTVALAICVFFAVPFYSIRKIGISGYLKNFIEPSPIMAPFETISQISRTFALAVRLFGNIMSGVVLVSIVVSILPLFLPIVLRAFELVIGQIQAYIFAILAMVYIASAARVQEDDEEEEEGSHEEGDGSAS